MIEKTLAKRYASAMLSVALKEGNVSDVEAQLLALKEAYEKDALFRTALVQPKIPRAERRRLLRRPFEGRASAAFLEFLGLLVEKNRVGLLPDIASAFDELADATSGVVRVDARSARPLSEGQRASLLEKLGRITGKAIRLDETVTPGLKAGLSVRIGDAIIDGTVAGRLKGLREHLTALERR